MNKKKNKISFEIPFAELLSSLKAGFRKKKEHRRDQQVQIRCGIKKYNRSRDKKKIEQSCMQKYRDGEYHGE